MPMPMLVFITIIVFVMGVSMFIGFIMGQHSDKGPKIAEVEKPYVIKWITTKGEDAFQTFKSQSIMDSWLSRPPIGFNPKTARVMVLMEV